MTTGSKRRATDKPAASSRPRSVAPLDPDEELWFGDDSSEIAETSAAKSMAAMAGRIIGAKPFPEAARRLDELTRNDKAHPHEVVRVLESDPALSARLLRLVNSAGYALRTRCTSVRHAAALVGVTRLNQVATTAAVLDMFATSSARAAALTKHAAAVGAMCRYLAVHFGLPRDEVATCGFLHDIGKLMLLDTEGDRYAALLDEAGSGTDQLHKAERKLLGFDHAVLGAHVLSAWNIPHPVPKVVAFHHAPARAMQHSPQVAAMVHVVRLADQLVGMMGRPHPESRLEEMAKGEAAQYLDISEPQLAAMWPDLRTIYRNSFDSGASLESLAPRRESVRPVEVPKHIPCGVCQKPSFGATCPACHRNVCPEHLSANGWCVDCLQDYQEDEAQTQTSPELRTSVTVGALSLAAVTAIVAWASGASATGILAAPLLAWLVFGIAGFAGYRAYKKIRFLRERRQRLTFMSLPQIAGPSEEALPVDDGPKDLQWTGPSVQPEAPLVVDEGPKDLQWSSAPEGLKTPPAVEEARRAPSRRSPRSSPPTRSPPSHRRRATNPDADREGERAGVRVGRSRRAPRCSIPAASRPSAARRPPRGCPARPGRFRGSPFALRNQRRASRSSCRSPPWKQRRPPKISRIPSSRKLP